MLKAVRLHFWEGNRFGHNFRSEIFNLIRESSQGKGMFECQHFSFTPPVETKVATGDEILKLSLSSQFFFTKEIKCSKCTKQTDDQNQPCLTLRCHLQDQAHRKQAALHRCSAEGTQASSSSTARIPSATHTAALMERGHLADPSLPIHQSHQKLSSQTPTLISLLKSSRLNTSNS